MASHASFLAEPPVTDAVTAAYEEDLASDGYVNNLTRAWAWRPDVLADFQKLRQDVVAASNLTPREVAVLVAATAAARGDSYCSLAWGIKLADLSNEETAAGVITGAEKGLSDREAALAQWARQLVGDPNATTEQDIANLRAEGLDDCMIFEATTWIGFRLAFSTINDALGAAPDDQMAQRAHQLVREAVSFGRRPVPAT
jgi:alkylhydroperoxidase family enzyme